MAATDIINVIGITGYVLLTALFLWVARLPGSQYRTKYWLIASIIILLGRVDLYLLSNWLPASYVQTIYALLLTTEKFFLILGLFYFFQHNVRYARRRILLVFTAITVLGVIIFNHLIPIPHAYPVWFAVTQAIFLVYIAKLFKEHTPSWFGKTLSMLPGILLFYALHWLSFPIAITIEWYLPIGFLLGNILNLVIYLSLAYMVLHQFEYRLLDAERSAKAKAEEALQASKTKSEFLANMSHEIRTPMNGILGMLEILMHSGLSKDQMGKAQLAYNSGTSLLSIINDILDFSKIEAGKLAIEKVHCDLRAMLEEVAHFMQSLAAEKELEFMLDTTELTITSVLSDPVRLRQILINLISNAIKFTPEGEIRVTARTTESEGNIVFHCSVKDTGIGIKPEQLDDMFTSFQQADTSTTRTYGGTGLGLTISKNLCELFGGDIFVSSEPGKGSCFSITIPVAAAEDEAETPMTLSDISALHNIDILVVDDNATNREILDHQLSMWNMRVTLADSAKSAVMLLNQSQTQFQIAILDMQMPGMDGEQLGKLLKSREDCQDISLIMLSSISDPELEKRVTSSNFERFLTKPALSSQLLQTLMGVITTEENESPEISLPETHNIEWQNNRILLVEDNEINQVVATELLNTLKLTCEIANHGAEAIDMLKVSAEQKQPFTHILMDCQMPIMDGYEATRQIRSGACGGEFTQIPVIALTANAMEGDKEKCLAAGMDDYLTKPYNADVVKSTLLRWLNNASSSPTGNTPTDNTPTDNTPTDNPLTDTPESSEQSIS